MTPDQQWEYTYIVKTHEVMLLYNFTPVGSRVREYEFGSAQKYKNLVVTLLADGWEPVGNDHFKRPYRGRSGDTSTTTRIPTTEAD